MSTPTPTTPSGTEALILGGVTVIDTRDGSLAPNRDVHIQNGRIIGITAATHGARGRLELAGKFVVPGYVDMHAHALNSASPAGALALMLANGITGFRQMNGSAKQLAQRRSGQLALPDAAPELLALTGDLLTPGNAGTPDAAVAAVRAGATEGSDFIKIAAVSPAAFGAAQAEAKRLGIRIGGHLPAAIDPRTATNAGLWSIEHLGPGIVLPVACSSDEQSLRDELAGAPELKLPGITLPFMDSIVGAVLRRMIVNPLRRITPTSADQLRRAVDTFSEDKARELAAFFAASDTWHVPTLIRQRTTQVADLPEFRVDPNLRYVARSTIRLWNKATDTFEKLPLSTRETLHRDNELELRLVKIFDEAGVKMAAGTDSTGAAWTIPGFALHQEFDLLAAAGVAPQRILRMATLNAAEMLGTTQTMGTVENGKLADLVVLDANPVESVAGLHAVSAIVRAGRFYSGSDLSDLKTAVASARSIDQ